jgi:type III pantothenate kinase
MILAMDVGNTNIKTGIYNGREMVEYVRFSTDMYKTSDEYGLMLMQFLAHKGIGREQIEAAVASSVVPSINFTLEHMCRTYLGFDPLLLGPGVKTGLNIRYDNPREVGSDRIATSVAAYEMYGGPAIVIDFGTATTFNAVSAEGEFLGGAIMPGIKLSTEALVANAAKLPRIELVRPETVINRTTITNMQAGIIYGYVGAVDNIVTHMRQELGDLSAQVIATGGLSRLISPESKTISRVNGSLTLEGLRIIYERNRRAT